MKHRKLIVGFMAGVCILACMPAFAWKSVFDSQNYAQNYATAINAIKTEANTAEMLRQQIQTNLHQANSVRSLGNLSGLSGLQQELSLYNQLKNIDSQMLDTVTKSKQLMDNLTGQYGASNLSWESFLKSRREISDSRNSNLLQQYETMNSEMKAVATRRQNIVNQLQSATGQTQALQAVGSAIDVLIGQNQQLISAMTAQGNAAVSQKYEDEAALRQSIKQANEYQNKLRESGRKVADL